MDDEFVSGADKVLDEIMGLGGRAEDVAARALVYAADNVVIPLSQERTPVLTGNLRATTRRDEPVQEGDTTSVTIKVGGEDAPYAMFVHENLEMAHPRGGQAKFLESAGNDSIATVLGVITGAMHEEWFG